MSSARRSSSIEQEPLRETHATHPDTERRLSRLEGEIKHVVEGMEAIQKTVKSLTDSVFSAIGKQGDSHSQQLSEINAKIAAVQTAQASSGKLELPLLVTILGVGAGWTTVLLGAVTWVGSMAIRPLEQEAQHVREVLELKQEADQLRLEVLRKEIQPRGGQ